MINVVLIHISNTYVIYIIEICQHIVSTIYFHVEETPAGRKFLEYGGKIGIFSLRGVGISSFCGRSPYRDSYDGLIKVTFQKDSKGQYSKCRVVAESLSLDIVGTKQK